MIDLDATLISAFANARQPIPRDVSVSVTQLLDSIQRGDYARKVTQVRTLHQQYKAGKINKGAYQEYKARHLEAVTIAGVFAGGRKAIHLQHHSGLVVGDIDDVDDHEPVRARLQGDLHIVFVFASPGGGGLKIGVYVGAQPDAQAHKRAFAAVSQHMASRYRIVLAPSGSDVNRLCYISADPDLYRNPGAIPLPIPAQTTRHPPSCQGPPVPTNGTHAQPGDALNACADLAWWSDLLARAGWAHDHNDDATGISYWTRPGKDTGVSASLGWQQPDGGSGQLWLYVWSSNGGPLGTGWHSPFSAYDVLEHGGDWRAAARALGRASVGAQWREPQNAPVYDATSWRTTTTMQEYPPTWRE